MIPVGAFVGYSLYELVSIPLYVRILVVLFSDKEFRTPFYRFISAIGVLELCHYVIDVAFYRLPMFGPSADWFGKAPSRALSAVPFLIYFLNYPVYFLHIAIAANRFTAVHWPIKHKKFWEKNCRCFVVVPFFFSLAMTAHRLFGIAQMVPLEPEDPSKGFTPLIVKYDFYSISQNLLTGIFNALVLLLCMSTNGATLAKIVHLKRTGVMKTASQKAEVHLFIIGVWMMSTLFVNIAFQIGLFIERSGFMSVADSNALTYALFLWQPITEILSTESHPWVLIIVSDQIRHAALPFM